MSLEGTLFFLPPGFIQIFFRSHPFKENLVRSKPKKAKELHIGECEGIAPDIKITYPLRPLPWSPLPLRIP